jgi:hypothetical protein
VWRRGGPLFCVYAVGTEASVFTRTHPRLTGGSLLEIDLQAMDIQGTMSGKDLYQEEDLPNDTRESPLCLQNECFHGMNRAESGAEGMNCRGGSISYGCIGVNLVYYGVA